MNDIKIQIDPDNRPVYLDTLEKFYNRLVTKQNSKFYDWYILGNVRELYDRIYKIKGKRKITVNFKDQLIIHIAFLFNGEMVANLVMFHVDKHIHPTVKELAKYYIHEIRKNTFSP